MSLSKLARRALVVATVIALAWLAAKLTTGRADWAPPAGPAEPGTR